MNAVTCFVCPQAKWVSHPMLNLNSQALDLRCCTTRTRTGLWKKCHLADDHPAFALKRASTRL